MTELLEKAVRTARAVPPEMQDDLARLMLTYLGEKQPVYELSPAERAAIARSKAAAAHGEFASDEEVRALWAKYGL